MSDDSNVSTAPVVPSSAELLNHYEDAHMRRCGGGRAATQHCPCGAIAITGCTVCGTILTVRLKGRKHCKHFAELQHSVESSGGRFA